MKSELRPSCSNIHDTFPTGTVQDTIHHKNLAVHKLSLGLWLWNGSHVWLNHALFTLLHFSLLRKSVYMLGNFCRLLWQCKHMPECRERTAGTAVPHYVAYDAHIANYTLQHIPTQHDMLPQHLVYKNELNHEYVITLARNDKNPWWWSEKIETCRSGFIVF